MPLPYPVGHHRPREIEGVGLSDATGACEEEYLTMAKRLRILALTMTAVGCAAVAIAQLPVKTATVVVSRDGQLISVNGVPVSAAAAVTPAPAKAVPAAEPSKNRFQRALERRTGGAAVSDDSDVCEPGFALIKGSDLCEDTMGARQALRAKQIREVSVRAGASEPHPVIPDSVIVQATLALAKGGTGLTSPQTLHGYGSTGDAVIVNWYKGGVGYDVANSLWREPAFVQFIVATEGSPEAAKAAAAPAAPPSTGVPEGYTESTMACDPATFKASGAICTANKRIAVPTPKRP